MFPAVMQTGIRQTRRRVAGFERESSRIKCRGGGLVAARYTLVSGKRKNPAGTDKEEFLQKSFFFIGYCLMHACVLEALWARVHRVCDNSV